MRKLQFSSIVLAAAGIIILSMTSCQKEPVEEKIPVLEITSGNDGTITVAPEGQQCSVEYSLENGTEDGSIKAESTDDWIDGLDYGTEGTVTFSVLPNGTGAERTATLTITYTYNGGEEVSASITISQNFMEIPESPDPVLEITSGNDGTITVAPEGQQCSVEYSLVNGTEDGSIKAESTDDWIDGLDYGTEGSVTFSALPNNTGAERTATLTITYTYNGGEEVSASVLIVQGIVPPDELNIPDPIFKEYLLETCDMDGDGYLTESDAEAWNSSDREKSFDLYFAGCSSLEGIEYFTALEVLDCNFNELSSLDLSKNTALTHLECAYNNLTSLDLSNNTALQDLQCGNNQLSSIDVGHLPALTRILCGQNPLNSIDVSQNKALQILECSDAQLTSIDISGNTALFSLSCPDNPLKSLDISNNISLTQLNCMDCQLTELDLSNNPGLTSISCDNNRLTELETSHLTELEELNCGGNQLHSLDVSNSPKLTQLLCNYNQLTSLEIGLQLRLTILWCNNNQLTELDVTGCELLEQFSCDENFLTTLDLSKNYQLRSASCYMESLQTLYWPKGKAIDEDSPYVHENTEIIYK